MRGAECWTDHRLIRTTLNLIIPPLHLKRPKLPGKLFNVAKLQHPQYLESFQSKLDEEHAAVKLPSVIPTEKWTRFRKAVTGSAKAVLDLKNRNHQDWFDENDVPLMILSPKRTRRTWSGKTIQALHLRRVGSNHTKPWCKGNYGRCMTNGGRRKLKKFRALLTPTTPSSSLAPLRRCLVLQNLAVVRCSLQTEPRSSRTRLLSEKDGKNTSASY